MAVFDGDKFRKLWASLDEETRDKIRDKAQHEHMTLAGVMREWWPRLWKKIEIEEDHASDKRTRHDLPSLRGDRKPTAPRRVHPVQRMRRVSKGG